MELPLLSYSCIQSTHDVRVITNSNHRHQLDLHRYVYHQIGWQRSWQRSCAAQSLGRFAGHASPFWEFLKAPQDILIMIVEAVQVWLMVTKH